MKQVIATAAAVLLLLTFSFAQNPAKTTIRGIVKDTTGEIIVAGTVMLLNPVDTTLVNFTQTNSEGAFVFNNVKNVPYLLKITYISYLPYQASLQPASGPENNLETITIKPISEELMEVVIRTAKAPLRIRGDTIEYDATTFKVPPGSTVEDLLRRLPGVEVDAAGNIKAQGEDVKRLYVDGKTFFGDDPKAATKNLGAETISKVQVFDGKSEQSKLTGVDDGKVEKTMNLELKEEYKKGAFGKVTGALGTKERWAARASYNRFNEKQQLSFIGYGNNINETGVNWDDYGEFKGQNAYTESDNADFGFGRGGRFYMMGGDDGIINNFDGRGFTKNAGAGANYNYDHKKTKFNTSYFYNQSTLNLDESSRRESFFSDNSFVNTDTSSLEQFRGNHSVNIRLEHEIDSNDIVIVKASTRFSTSTVNNTQQQLFFQNGETPINNLSNDKDSELKSWNINSSVIYRHKFSKKGRSFAISGGYIDNNRDKSENQLSINQFFEATTFTEQIRLLNADNTRSRVLKSSMLFTEPLSKKIYWETFFNISQTTNISDHQVSDLDHGGLRLDSLTNFYDYQINYNRLGTSLRYAHEGANFSLGLAGQRLGMIGKYALGPEEPLLTPPLERSFTNLIPYAEASYQFKNNMHLGANYSYDVSEPSISDLQPIPNISNPAFRTIGNPDLIPERSHDLGLSLNYWNPASFSNIGFHVGGQINDMNIVYNQSVELVDSIGIVTTSQPANIAGGGSGYSYLWSNFPIIKTKLTFGINGNANISSAPSLINDVENETNNLGYGIGADLSLTPGQKLIMRLSGGIDFNHITYSIQKEQNQDIRNYNADMSVKWQVVPKTFLESNLNYRVYKNDRFGFDQSIPIWNASVRRLLGKKNRFEMRLAVFDILNRNVAINQNGWQNYVTTSVANTLARYFMLSVSYNVRGYESSVKSGGWW